MINSWTSCGMDWTNPNPVNLNYWRALYLARDEKFGARFYADDYNTVYGLVGGASDGNPLLRYLLPTLNMDYNGGSGFTIAEDISYLNELDTTELSALPMPDLYMTNLSDFDGGSYRKGINLNLLAAKLINDGKMTGNTCLTPYMGGTSFNHNKRTPTIYKEIMKNMYTLLNSLTTAVIITDTYNNIYVTGSSRSRTAKSTVSWADCLAKLAATSWSYSGGISHSKTCSYYSLNGTWTAFESECLYIKVKNAFATTRPCYGRYPLQYVRAYEFRKWGTLEWNPIPYPYTAYATVDVTLNSYDDEVTINNPFLTLPDFPSLGSSDAYAGVASSKFDHRFLFRNFQFK